MSSCGPRINRRTTVGRKFTKGTYGKARPYLLVDFDNRCAYSMQHIEDTGTWGMEIDHFNSTLRGSSLHAYANLYLASKHCNRAKWFHWPHAGLIREGIRFLDPCKETEYGVVIFEDPDTHYLVGTTPAANYHIRILDLNAPFLIQKRKDRSDIEKVLESSGFVHGDLAAFTQAVSSLKTRLKFSIPPIEKQS